MTHPNLVTNGASLEDCHTNFFALADLCGLKWRRLSLEPGQNVSGLYGGLDGGGAGHGRASEGGSSWSSDPVLSSFARCLGADLLCVWRRVSRSDGLHPSQHRRELWLFWYGEEPDLAGLVSPELTDTEQGSWENGLSYECRSLLFKALHNLIQRCLLSRGFTRLGRWFLQPGDGSEKEKGSPQLTFAFNFFVHGDSTVCASIDVRQHPAVSRMTRQHLLLAHASHTGTKIILGPFGMAGILTGQGFKETDGGPTQAMLAEWSQFFPLPSQWGSNDAAVDEDSLPSAVEVVVGGVKLRYPSAYVFVVETDETVVRQLPPPPGPVPAPPPYNCSHPSQYRPGPPPYPGVKSGPQTGLLTGVLTPPTSPCNPGYGATADGGDRAPYMSLLSPSPWTAMKVKESAWQDAVRGSADDAEADSGGCWDFVEPCNLGQCSCFRCTRSKACSVSPVAASGGASKKSSPDKGSNLTSQQQPQKRTSGVPTVAGSVSSAPFHRRSPVPNMPIDFESLVSATAHPVTKGGSTHGPSGGSTLPQLQVPLVPPSSVGSHPGTPLLLHEGGPASQMSAAADPAMPTLSPHPPPREDSSVCAGQQEVAPSAPRTPLGTSPAVQAGEKERLTADQLMSPASLLDAKPSLDAPPSCSPGGNTWGGGSSSSAAATPAPQPVGAAGVIEEQISAPSPGGTVTVPTVLQPQHEPGQLAAAISRGALKRPALPTGSHEVVDDLVDNQFTSGLLYDYSTVNAPTWDLPPSKRAHVGPPRRFHLGDGPYRTELSFSEPNVSVGGDLQSVCKASNKDPYEFLDDFDEDGLAVAPAVTGDAPGSCGGVAAAVPVVRRPDVLPIKEEDKKEGSVGDTCSEISGILTPGSNGGATTVVTGGEPLKDAKEGAKAGGGTPGELVGVTSPPRHPGFTRVEDLKVTDCDLENIFDTSSSDESGDDPFQAPSTPSSTKLAGMNEDHVSKSKNTAGILGAAELTRMFPTPPSLEHNAAPSPSGPVGAPDLSLGDALDQFFGRGSDYLNYGSPGFEGARDWSYVYKPPTVQTFVSSSRYAPMANLPSASLPPLPPLECSYKPTWQQHIVASRPMTPPPANQGPPLLSQQRQALPHYHPAVGHPVQQQGPQHMLTPAGMMMGPGMHHGMVDRHPSHHPHVSTLDERGCYQGQQSLIDGPIMDPRGHQNMQGGHYPMDYNHPYGARPGAVGMLEGTLPLPEADPILVNLLLSDSLLEIFRDHNFSSCTICVCNMNIKGADVGVYLPTSLVPTASDEPQYKCTCGFSAVVNRHHAHRTGLFYEDEVDITGIPYDTPTRPKFLNRPPGNGFPQAALHSLKVEEASLLEYVQTQCSGMSLSACSLFHKALELGAERLAAPIGTSPSGACAPRGTALLPALDGCEVAASALEASLSRGPHDPPHRPSEELLRASCLHQWAYLQARCPSSSAVAVGLLRTLQPLLQDAVHKKRNQGLWEVTYRVAGPLTWRQFHRLAGRGTEDQCEPQPIPSLLVGYDRDWLALSPFALKYWDKLLLEPYSPSRDVAYVVVLPDSDMAVSSVKTFFQELSATYEALNLGRHCPLSRGGLLRDGMLRVGRCTTEEDVPLDDWFLSLGENPMANRLRMYARACQQQLGPHLATQTLDRGLLDPPAALSSKVQDSKGPAASPRPPPTPEGGGQDREGAPTPKPESESSQETVTSSVPSGGGSNGQCGSQGGSNMNNLSMPSAPAHSTPPNGPLSAMTDEGEEEGPPPVLVIYLVEPFTMGSSDPEVLRLAAAGMHRCFTQMQRCLPQHLQSNTHTQVVTLDWILRQGKGADRSQRQEQLRALALSVFYQCTRLLLHQSNVKSLTGFGPAAAQDEFLKSKPNAPLKVWSPPFVLAPHKDKQTELGEMFGDRMEKSGILFCAYCLTEDQRWLLASISNDRGDLLYNCTINVEIPNRSRRKKASARRVGLHKLLDWILDVASSGSHPWRLVMGRVGRVGHGELREWAALLGRRSLLRYSRRLRELCNQCAATGGAATSGGAAAGPCILSACLVSLEPDGALRLFHDCYTPDERFSSACHSCDLSTPQDASATHILVFPTSATTQSSQATFQQDHIDPLGDDDEIFKSLTEDIAVGNDFNDILNWTDSPEAPCSPTRRSSPPGSPGGVLGGGGGGRQSPFHQSGTLRSNGGMGVESQEEPMQLLQQPLALGYYVSTAKAGLLPRWFWASCPHLRDSSPVFLKSALLLHCPTVHQNHDDILHSNPHLRNYHPLDSNLTTDVLRYVLEGYNTLSWLALNPHTHDRQSCLPLHMQNLMKLYHAVEAFL